MKMFNLNNEYLTLARGKFFWTFTTYFKTIELLHRTPGIYNLGVFMLNSLRIISLVT